MSKLTDKEIQKLLDQQQSLQGDDADLYQKVYHALEKEPDFELSAQFSDKVIGALSAKSSFLEKMLLALAAFGILSTLILAVILIKMFASPTVVEYLPYMGVGSVFIILIQWLDKYSRKAVSL